MAAVLLMVGQHIVLNHQAAQQAQQAYQQGLAEAGVAPTPLDISPDVHVNAATLLEAIQSSEELVSYKYYYEAVGDFTKDKKFFNTQVSVPFTKDRSLFTYRGTMSAGIDLTSVSFAVDDAHKLVTASLPQPKLLSHEFEIDSFKIYDLKNSLFTSTKLSDYAGLEKELKELQESKLSDNEEFWENVKSNTELVLNDLLVMSGRLNDYLLQFKWD